MIPEELRARFRDSLIRGEYNLLLGAGVCLDSVNGLGANICTANQLRRDLCALTGAPEATSLSRVAGLLTREQRGEHLVKRFSGCQPGPSLRHLPHYLWRRLFTFNIDNALE